MHKRTLTADDLGTLFFLMAMIFGIWFRLYPPSQAGFPIGDGGLFYMMSKALQQNHYRLPEVVHYNGLTIPFVYPPLGFYVAAFITDIFHTSLLPTLQWLPANVLITTIPATYFLALAILKSRFKAGLAAFYYAVVPGLIAWLIMGGGIKRSFGQLFLILATRNIFLLFTTKQKRFIIYSIICSSLVCLSHPEATIHTVVIALVLWLFYGRCKDGIKNTLLVALGTLLFTSPWWMTVLIRFGPSPFLAASQTGFNQAVLFLVPFTAFSQEKLLPILAILAIIGIVVSVAKREYLLPILYIVPFLIEPRNATNVYIVPLALLASVATVDLLMPGLSKLENEARTKEHRQPAQSLSAKLLFAYLAICLLFGMILSGAEISENRIAPDVRTSFDWVRSNTPVGSEFLIVTGKTGLLNEFTGEWFPALAERQSMSTTQGTEWLKDNLFAQRAQLLSVIRMCYSSTGLLKCLEDDANLQKLNYDYIFITPPSDIFPCDKSSTELAVNCKYQTVYSSNDVLILKKVLQISP